MRSLWACVACVACHQPAGATSSGAAASASVTAAAQPSVSVGSAAPSASSAPIVPFSRDAIERAPGCADPSRDEPAVRRVLEGILRATVARFEKGGATCKSATLAPRELPKGTLLSPSEIEGEDFETGDDATGWRCLRFAITQKVSHRYGYRAGGDYLGAARGLPNAGPAGFEASASADLDGDGEASLYVMIGFVDSGRVVIPEDAPGKPRIFCAAPNE